ncbi:hypothetical protein MIT9_P2428 [Methylomarinovum caldicuralii]|uniref:Membrane transport protein MMPL domain-containing protein n=1 Tax=Methylomarinovum caldicuralii TaxID=438856 RepID=A0AAU9C265_9GAMM|nr:hypothetical protein MIT9_P2428 [Methylomarinovum caldicuralii]
MTGVSPIYLGFLTRWRWWIVAVTVILVTTMTMGIVVDDTVHFLSKWLHARRRLRLDAEAGVEYAFAGVGVAMWITSLVLAAGFAILIWSDFEVNAQMGLMTAITILFALAADFLLLPSLLLGWREKCQKILQT